ncbi:pyridoxamine 5'-phosphate oxidase family protein [Rhodobacteraceae bacterium 2376]|uniref:Pyridoxamine 5'-phosphate oxidase family protein n=1 Tax=Rhabdonatronobacter sediminivivens TaxID=2743469 RepID=A0A7Z0KXT0_9RHOB|nr:pyridoxamine 5'-phosphate oxidase family protein [Rhabdonatronobacter sediminivivens]NYS24679.1 pyridoxamine 5'-phosphate oxidase family protein [Rhabdonatronobacter sediminivivens]
MSHVTSLEELEALYGTPSGASLDKVAPQLTPAYARWIERSRFCILSTAGPMGVQATPRGDDGPVVRIDGPRRLLMPDWRGNNRLDNLRNIVADGRASLMFLVPGSNNVVRCNGRAVLSRDAALLESFARKGVAPRTVIDFTLAEVYIQCARALMRAGLWQAGNCAEGLPSVGDVVAEVSAGGFDGAAYDAAWHGRARDTMW